jgi:hypothetical protein
MSTFALRRRLGRLPLQSASEPATLTTLFGEGYGLSRTRRSSFVLSFLGHMLAIAVFLAAGRFVAVHHHEIRQQVIGIVTEVSPYILPPERRRPEEAVAVATATNCKRPKEPCRASLASNWLLRR